MNLHISFIIGWQMNQLTCPSPYPIELSAVFKNSARNWRTNDRTACNERHVQAHTPAYVRGLAKVDHGGGKEADIGL